jgi:hypothetical protein
MKSADNTTGKASTRDLLIAVAVLGSIWGFFEVVGGGAMKAADIPRKGDILTGLGVATMAIAVAAYRKPLLLIGIAVVAVAVKQLAVPILGLQLICKANSCLAVTLGGAALAGTSAIAGRRLKRGILPRVATGFSAGLLTSVSFYFIGMRVAPCRYLLSFSRPGGFVAFMIAEGIIWAALSGLLFPVGYRIGETLSARVFDLRARQSLSYYIASGLLVAGCWISSAFAIASGL